MQKLFHGDAVGAANLFRHLVKMARSLETSPDESGALYYHLAMALVACQEMEPARKAFDRALTLFKTCPEVCPALLCRLAASLWFPESFPREGIETWLQHLMTDRYHDPYWYLYARVLWNTGLPEGRAYLIRHFRLTSHERQTGLKSRIPGLGRLFSKLALVQEPTGQWTILGEGSQDALSEGEYRAWQKTRPAGRFRFDAPAGCLWFGTRRGFLRPGSLPHQVLTQVLLARPEAVELGSLFRVIWGGEYDPACDAAGLKACLLRLRASLAALSPGLTLEWDPGWKAPGRLLLRLGPSWQAVVA